MGKMGFGVGWIWVRILTQPFSNRVTAASFFFFK